MKNETDMKAQAAQNKARQLAPAKSYTTFEDQREEPKLGFSSLSVKLPEDEACRWFEEEFHTNLEGFEVWTEAAPHSDLIVHNPEALSYTAKTSDEDDMLDIPCYLNYSPFAHLKSTTDLIKENKREMHRSFHAMSLEELKMHEWMNNSFRKKDKLQLAFSIFKATLWLCCAAFTAYCAYSLINLLSHGY